MEGCEDLTLLGYFFPVEVQAGLTGEWSHVDRDDRINMW